MRRAGFKPAVKQVGRFMSVEALSNDDEDRKTEVSSTVSTKGERGDVRTLLPPFALTPLSRCLSAET